VLDEVWEDGDLVTLFFVDTAGRAVETTDSIGAHLLFDRRGSRRRVGELSLASIEREGDLLVLAAGSEEAAVGRVAQGIWVAGMRACGEL
jgi:hypothetical protein